MQSRHRVNKHCSQILPLPPPLPTLPLAKPPTRMPRSILSRHFQPKTANIKATQSKSKLNFTLNTELVIMPCTALTIILCLLANLNRIQSLHTAEQPSCAKGSECSKHGPPSTNPNYIAVKDDPNYNITDDKWKNMTFNNLYDHLDCYQHAINRSKAFYTEEMYSHMKAKYSELTDYKFKPLSKKQDVFHIGMSEGAGRGVFASRDIKKGEVIPFDATCSVVTFTDGQLWRQYIFSLPRTMACDVLEWTWTQNVHSMGDVRLCLSIGDGDSFLNNADIDEDINIAPTDLTSMTFEATRDIPKGEELIYDYEVFEPTEYGRFGIEFD